MLAITYFYLSSEISLSVYWEGDLKANGRREHISFISYNYTVQIAQALLMACPL